MYPSQEFIDLNFGFIYALIDAFTVDDPRINDARKNLDQCKTLIYGIATDLYQDPKESEE